MLGGGLLFNCSWTADLAFSAKNNPKKFELYVKHFKVPIIYTVPIPSGHSLNVHITRNQDGGSLNLKKNFQRHNCG